MTPFAMLLNSITYNPILFACIDLSTIATELTEFAAIFDVAIAPPSNFSAVTEPLAFSPIRVLVPFIFLYSGVTRIQPVWLFA